MHEPRAHPQPPQRRRAQLVGGVLRPYLHDPVACFDVMKQTVAVGMDDLVSQRFVADDLATVDPGSRTRGPDRCHVASGAAERVEQMFSRYSWRSCRQDFVAWRNLRATDELREVIDIG